MKKLFVLLATLMLAGIAQAALLTDFTGGSLVQTSPVRHENSDSALDAKDGVWAGDIRQFVLNTSGGNPDSYMFMQGANETADRYTATWFTVAELGLASGQEYTFTFDYNAINIDAGLFATFSAFSASDTGAPGVSIGATGDNSERPLIIAQGDGIVGLDNESFAADATSNTGLGWKTYTTTSTFQIRATDTWIAIGFSVEGLDDGASESIGIDNININAIPEPATFGLLGLGVLVTLVARRKRA